MNNRVQTILEDLYRIDPAFKAHETELRKLVSEFVLSKPETKFDESFAQELRARLMTEEAAASKNRPSGSSRTVLARPSPYADFLGKVAHFKYAFGGALAMLLFVAPVTYLAFKNQSAFDTGFALRPDVTLREFGAFGSLASNQESVGSLGMGGGDVSMKTMGESEIGIMRAPDGAGAASMPSPLIYPSPVPVRQYEYQGGLFSVSDTGLVFKRVKDVRSDSDLLNILRGSNLGLVNIGGLKNLKVRNIDLYEEGRYGHEISINFAEGMIAINPYWPGWNSDSRDIAGVEMPDTEIISISNQFVVEYGIDTTAYGIPVIDSVFSNESTDSTMPAYAPTSVTVTYPLSLQGVAVKDESGAPHGLQVVVETAARRVSGVYNLASQRYESAPYELETDTNRILEYARQGGSQGHAILAREGMNNQSAALGTPDRVLMRYWTFGSEPQELYVPALAFPIIESERYPGLNYILVPLVKEFLGERMGQ